MIIRYIKLICIQFLDDRRSSNYCRKWHWKTKPDDRRSSNYYNIPNPAPRAGCQLFRQHQVPPCIKLHGFAPDQVIDFTGE